MPCYNAWQSVSQLCCNFKMHQCFQCVCISYGALLRCKQNTKIAPKTRADYFILKMYNCSKFRLKNYLNGSMAEWHQNESIIRFFIYMLYILFYIIFYWFDAILYISNIVFLLAVIIKSLITRKYNVLHSMMEILKENYILFNSVLTY